jgi:putative ABC transport system ATP-binding protein
VWETYEQAAGSLDSDVLWARDVVSRPEQTGGLKGLSLSARRGETVAVTGPAGSGKSRLLHCLAGILTPQSGEVWFDGHALHTLPEADRARLRRVGFGVAFQRGQLVPELTAEENVALPLLFSDRDSAEALAWARGCLDLLDVADCARLRPSEMSVAKVKRMTLARALVASPRVLLVDEPALGLDPREGAHLMRVLTAAVREREITLVLASQDVRLAAYADRQVAVDAGRVMHGPVLV